MIRLLQTAPIQRRSQNAYIPFRSSTPNHIHRPDRVLDSLYIEASYHNSQSSSRRGLSAAHDQGKENEPQEKPLPFATSTLSAPFPTIMILQLVQLEGSSEGIRKKYLSSIRKSSTVKNSSRTPARNSRPRTHPGAPWSRELQAPRKASCTSDYFSHCGHTTGQNLSLIASGAFLKCIESIDAHTRCIDVAVAHESPQISSGSLTEAILTEVQKPFRHLNRSRIGTSPADPVGV